MVLPSSGGLGICKQKHWKEWLHEHTHSQEMGSCRTSIYEMPCDFSAPALQRMHEDRWARGYHSTEDVTIRAGELGFFSRCDTAEVRAKSTRSGREKSVEGCLLESALDEVRLLSGCSPGSKIPTARLFLDYSPEMFLNFGMENSLRGTEGVASRGAS